MTTRRVSGRTLLFATGGLAAALLAGCSSPQAFHAGTASAVSGAQSATGQSATGQSGTGQTASASPRRTEATPSASPRCHTADLGAVLGTKRATNYDPQGELGAAGTHYAIDLIWTNHSTHTCTLSGYSGVDLDGPNPEPGGASTYSLPRAGGSPRTVTLAPGGTAYTVIDYIDPSTGGAAGGAGAATTWTPTHLEVTPPNETTQLSVPWTAGTPVDDMDKGSGAAAASISPVQSQP